MGIYIGVRKPIREETTQTVTVNIDENNVSEYFDVANGSTYYFAGNGGVFTSNNGAKKSSSATTDLTLKRDLAVSFDYSYSSEANYDKCFLYVDGIQKAVIHGEVAWATASIVVTGDGEHSIEWRYKKDGSVSRGSDCVWLDDVSWRAS